MGTCAFTRSLACAIGTQRACPARACAELRAQLAMALFRTRVTRDWACILCAQQRACPRAWTTDVAVPASTKFEDLERDVVKMTQVEPRVDVLVRACVLVCARALGQPVRGHGSRAAPGSSPDNSIAAGKPA